MKLASLAFLIILVGAHGAGDPSQLLGLPLSMFRDGHLGVFGGALFALLLGIAGLMVHTLRRRRLRGDATFFSLAACFLVLVALTPSEDGFHFLCSLVLFALLYAYYAIQVREAGIISLWAHLVIPAVLLGVTGCHSYGLWQKGFIVYFLLAVNVHHHLLASGRVGSERAAANRPYMGGGPSRRRLVYVLEPGQSWSRRKIS
jgi:hypothetical protein